MLFFFFNETATTEIYTLSLHDALPISDTLPALFAGVRRVFVVTSDPTVEPAAVDAAVAAGVELIDRKSTRLNSSHANISYAVFCLKKKKIRTTRHNMSTITLTTVSHNT